MCLFALYFYDCCIVFMKCFNNVKQEEAASLKFVFENICIMPERVVHSCLHNVNHSCFGVAIFICFLLGCRSRDRMVVAFMHSVPITTSVVSSNPTQPMCTRYNIM